MLKSFLIIKNSILVFNNVKNQSEIKEIISIDDICACNGSTLIVTIWDSKAIKHCNKKNCKINIKKLDKEVNVKLVIIRFCSQDTSRKIVEIEMENKYSKI